MRSLQLMHPKIKSAGAGLVAISPQTIAASRETAKQLNITFPLLSDPCNGVAEELGLVFKLRDDLQKIYTRGGYDLAETNGEDSWKLPTPATFVVDRQGSIAWRFVNPNYAERAEPSDLLFTINDLEHHSAG